MFLERVSFLCLYSQLGPGYPPEHFLSSLSPFSTSSLTVTANVPYLKPLNFPTVFCISLNTLPPSFSSSEISVSKSLHAASNSGNILANVCDFPGPFLFTGCRRSTIKTMIPKPCHPTHPSMPPPSSTSMPNPGPSRSSLRLARIISCFIYSPCFASTAVLLRTASI